MTPRTLAETIAALPHTPVPRLAAPIYTGESAGRRVGLAVESMQRHMTDEGWQIFLALQHAGYDLVGRLLPRNEVDVVKIIHHLKPSTVVVQDKREWDVVANDFRDRAARFSHIEALAQQPKIFKLTILKDSQQRPQYHLDSAAEMGCHAWIIYYHPWVVTHLATYVRPEHCIRTYHSLDQDYVPRYEHTNRGGCLLSGAISGAYPLRTRLFREAHQLPDCHVLPHPGYHRNGSATPGFLRTLTRYKVALCTSSIYGYALRKLIEATACGCVVITDLPTDEILPEIDENMVRVHPQTPTAEIAKLVRHHCQTYNPERQEAFAKRAKAWYDYRQVGIRLAQDIEQMRVSYAHAV